MELGRMKKICNVLEGFSGCLLIVPNGGEKRGGGSGGFGGDDVGFNCRGTYWMTNGGILGGGVGFVDGSMKDGSMMGVIGRGRG